MASYIRYSIIKLLALLEQVINFILKLNPIFYYNTFRSTHADKFNQNRIKNI